MEARPEEKGGLFVSPPEPDVLGIVFWEEDGWSLTIEQRLLGAWEE